MFMVYPVWDLESPFTSKTGTITHPEGCFDLCLIMLKLTFISHDFVSDIRILSEKAGLLWSWYSQWNMAVLWIFWCYYKILMWGTCFQINLSQGGNRTGKYHSFSLYGQGNHRGESVGMAGEVRICSGKIIWVYFTVRVNSRNGILKLIQINIGYYI